MKIFKKISVIGLGYIGLPTAALFASRKISVVGVDVRSETVATINAGNIHIVEPDLDIVVSAAVSQGYLRATLEVETAEAFLLAVPTPFKGDDHSPDLSYIQHAAKAIAKVLAPGNIVVLESTSPVGTTEKLSKWLADERPDLTFPQDAGEASDVRIAYCPERVLPGKVMQELISNDRVIGGMTTKCSDVATELYKVFVDGECVQTNARTAEMAKLTENSFRDVNIAFANELSMICDTLEIDVWELISLANRHPRVNILQPGPGVGGHCIAVDPWFIVSRTPEQAQLIRTAREVNDTKPEWVLGKVQEAVGTALMKDPSLSAKDIRIACYGLTFKPDIDDLRESPALEIVKELVTAHPGPIVVVEPNISALPDALNGHAKLVGLEDAVADLHVLLVDHGQFKEMTPPNVRFIDTRGIWK